MGLNSVVVALNLAVGALAHGYVKYVGVDNKLYVQRPTPSPKKPS
jgi:hypothetical protein